MASYKFTNWSYTRWPPRWPRVLERTETTDSVVNFRFGPRRFPGLRYGYYHTEGSDLLPYGRSGDCAGGTNGVKVYSVEFPGLGSGGITLLELPVWSRELSVAKRRDGWGGARRGEAEPSPVGGAWGWLGGGEGLAKVPEAPRAGGGPKSRAGSGVLASCVRRYSCRCCLRSLWERSVRRFPFSVLRRCSPGLARSNPTMSSALEEVRSSAPFSSLGLAGAFRSVSRPFPVLSCPSAAGGTCQSGRPPASSGSRPSRLASHPPNRSGLGADPAAAGLGASACPRKVAFRRLPGSVWVSGRRVVVPGGRYVRWEAWGLVTFTLFSVSSARVTLAWGREAS